MEISHGKKQNDLSIVTQLFVFPVAPRRQFRRLVYFCLAVLLLSVALHGYVLYRIHDHQIFFANSAKVETLPTVDEAKLQSVLSEYSAKASQEQAAQVANPSVAEPNI